MSIMKKVLVLLAIIGLFTAGLGPDSDAARRRRIKRVSSEISAEFTNPEGSTLLFVIPIGEDATDTFEGQVLSTEEGCYRGRLVNIYKAGEKAVVASTRTDGDGKWIVGKEDPAAGNYYAVALETRFKAKKRRVICRKANSETMVV